MGTVGMGTWGEQGPRVLTPHTGSCMLPAPHLCVPHQKEHPQPPPPLCPHPIPRPFAKSCWHLLDKCPPCQPHAVPSVLGGGPYPQWDKPEGKRGKALYRNIPPSTQGLGEVEPSGTPMLDATLCPSPPSRCPEVCAVLPCSHSLAVSSVVQPSAPTPGRFGSKAQNEPGATVLQRTAPGQSTPTHCQQETPSPHPTPASIHSLPSSSGRCLQEKPVAWQQFGAHRHSPNPLRFPTG